MQQGSRLLSFDHARGPEWPRRLLRFRGQQVECFLEGFRRTIAGTGTEDQRGGPVIPVQVIERMQVEEFAPVGDFFLGEQVG